MRLLRRVLYWNAAIWTVAGLALAGLPKFTLVSVLDQVEYPEYAWIRIAGLEAIGLAMLMVLVAQRLEELWWWSWAFVVIEAAIALVCALNATLGLPPRASSLIWWVFAGAAAGSTTGLVAGLAKTGAERPFA